MKKFISTVLMLCCFAVLFFACGSKKESISNFKHEDVDKIQVINSMGNPAYGAESKIITDKKEVADFLDTFNGGILGQKAKDKDVKIGFSSRYLLYKDEKIIAEYFFNCNDTSLILLNDEYRKVTYANDAKTPLELYESSKSGKIVVDIAGQEMDLVRFGADTYIKSKLSKENLEWLDNYSKMSKEEQASVTDIPDFGESFRP